MVVSAVDPSVMPRPVFLKDFFGLILIWKSQVCEVDFLKFRNAKPFNARP
jgi:hypothetical protein